MVISNQFSAKVSYVTPSLKSLDLAPRASMMNVASPNSWNQGGAGNGGDYEEEEIL